MTNQPTREFWIYIGEIDDIVFTQPKHLKNQDKYIHVIEAGPVLEKIARLEAALVKAKRMTDHIFEKGNVNWGQTFVKWDIMNEGLIAMDEMKYISESK